MLTVNRVILFSLALHASSTMAFRCRGASQFPDTAKRVAVACLSLLVRNGGRRHAGDLLPISCPLPFRVQVRDLLSPVPVSSCHADQLPGLPLLPEGFW